jgi:predicted 3-demethylubiquinone-9 3-methyltransferase (glyoxalase superfamily)
MQKITPFLWFDGKVEEAMNFYLSVFKKSKVVRVSRAGPNGPVVSATFQLDGMEFHALNGGPMFSFTPAISFFVNVETQAELDELWGKLTEGGSEEPCGWLRDKFGVSWQVIPSILGRLLTDKDPARAGRAMQAMLKMKKLDIAALQRAGDGA